jgi:hypothetical protein
MKKKNLVVLLILPFLISVIGVVTVNTTLKTIEKDILSIEWGYQDLEAFKLSERHLLKAEAIKELADTFSVSVAVAKQMADAGYLTVEGIAEDDEVSFIAATALDEVAAKGIYAAAKAVAELTGKAGEEA